MSPTLIVKLHFVIEGREIPKFPLMNVPIRNMTIRKLFIRRDSLSRGNNHCRIIMKKIQMSDFLNFLNNFANSIETLKLVEVNFGSSLQFQSFFKILGRLKHVEIISCELKVLVDIESLNLPNLQSVSLKNSSNSFFKAFEGFKHLEVLKYVSYDKNVTLTRDLNDLLVKLPTIQHLSLDDVNSAFFINAGPFDFKLSELDVYSTTPDYVRDSFYSERLFYESQEGHLKEMNLQKLPYDNDGGEILRFLLEEMNFEKFVINKTTLIENGSKVEGIDEIEINQMQIFAGLELLRQFMGEISP